MEIFDFLIKYIVVLPAVIYIFFKKKDKVEYFFLGIILILGILSEMISHYFAAVYKNNVQVHNVFYLLEFLATFIFLGNKLEQKGRAKLVMSLIMFAMTFLWAYEVFIEKTIFETALVFRILSSFVLLFYSINYLNKETLSSITKRNPNTVIASSLILFYSYTVFLSLITSSLFKLSDKKFISLWNIAKINNLIFYLLIAIAFLWIRKK